MFIAEIGINHNGDIGKALELIDMAKAAGADVVKFQKRSPEHCVPYEQRHVKRDTPWGVIDYIDYKHMIEFGEKEYSTIDSHCKSIGIKWTASVWDIESVDFLMNYNVPFIKIPSALVNNRALLEAVANTKKDIVISTGMNGEEEIINALETLIRCGVAEENLTIMSCCSAYPAPLDELNISTVKYFKSSFPQAKVGFSSHSLETLPTLISKAFGATVFEHHITTCRKSWGSDQGFSLESEELKKLIKRLHEVDVMTGNQIPGVTRSEAPAKKKLESHKLEMNKIEKKA